MFTLEKAFRFEASHQLRHHDGKCARLHGHSWVGKVVVQGLELVLDGPKRGMLIDYYELSKLIAPLVEEFLDHHHLNYTLNNDTPTSEFIAQWLFWKLEPSLGVYLQAVVIEETCTASCRFGRGTS